VQQGTYCAACKTNVRSQALARAVLEFLSMSGPLESCIERPPLLTRRLLEINEAGTLTPWLSRLPGHVLARYPDVDIMRLPFDAGAFDLVVHSDTLEHVSDPLVALAECRRVLAAGGACLFTVPVIVGRLTRSREGRAPSYHGNPGCRDAGYVIRTEFGADAWTFVLRAGFESCQMVPFRYPAGMAIIGRPKV
jgi:SAM-dependent methyltransferase